MREVDLIIQNASQVITCASNKPKRGDSLSDLAIITNGAIAIKDGVIVAVGTDSGIKNGFKGREVIDASGKTIIPGFIDCHTHVVHGGERVNELEMRIRGASYMEILKSGGGILSTVEATREASIDELTSQTQRRLDKMLQHGTTTVESKSGYGLNKETELKMMQVTERLDQSHVIDLLPTFLGAHSIPSEYKGRTNEYVSLVIQEMIPTIAKWYAKSHFKESTVPLFIDVFCEDGVFDVQQSQRIFEAGKRVDMRIKAHVDEFVALGGTKMAIDMGAISVDHLDATPDEEIVYLAQSNTIGVGLPVVNLNLGNTHYAKLRALIDQGGAIALATDYNPGSAPCFSIPYVMGIATRYQRLSPAEALNASTINAAFAAGIGNRVGSLEVGKQADILILNTTDYRHLTYYLGENFIESVIKRGQVIL